MTWYFYVLSQCNIFSVRQIVFYFPNKWFFLNVLKQFYLQFLIPNLLIRIKLSYLFRKDTCEKVRKARDYHFVSPYDDVDVIAGQVCKGTVGGWGHSYFQSHILNCLLSKCNRFFFYFLGGEGVVCCTFCSFNFAFVLCGMLMVQFLPPVMVSKLFNCSLSPLLINWFVFFFSVPCLQNVFSLFYLGEPPNDQQVQVRNMVN